MKNLRVTGLLAAYMLLMAACVKNDPPVATQPAVSINVINATEDVLNFYLNGTRQNSTTGISPLGANGTVSIPYGSVLTFKKQFDRFSYENADVLFTVPVNVDTVGTSKQYTLFAAGQTSNDAFFLRDTLVSDSKNAKLRFVVASPEVTKLKVSLNDTVRFTTTIFKQASIFTPVGNGAKTLIIRDADTNEVLFTTRIALAVNNNYTLFTQGKRGVNPTFRAGLIIN